MATFCDGIVQNIDRTECIGNSLVKINNNFTGLESAGCVLENTVDSLFELIKQTQSTFASTLHQVKLSPFDSGLMFSSNSASLSSSHTLIHLHSYDGNKVGLYDISTLLWKETTIPKTTSSGTQALASFPLKAMASTGGASSSTGVALDANSLFDIYLYNTITDFNNPVLNLEYVKWSNKDTPPTRQILNEVYTKNGDFSKKLIGVVCTTIAGTSEFQPTGNGGMGAGQNLGWSNGASYAYFAPKTTAKIFLQNTYNRKKTNVVAIHAGNDYVKPVTSMNGGGFKEWPDPIRIGFINVGLNNEYESVEGGVNVYNGVTNGTTSWNYNGSSLIGSDGVTQIHNNNSITTRQFYMSVMENDGLTGHLMQHTTYNYSVPTGLKYTSLVTMYGQTSDQNQKMYFGSSYTGIEAWLYI